AAAPPDPPGARLASLPVPGPPTAGGAAADRLGRRPRRRAVHGPAQPLAHPRAAAVGPAARGHALSGGHVRRGARRGASLASSTATHGNNPVSSTASTPAHHCHR